MAQPRTPDLLRSLTALEDLVKRARTELQETTETHPQLEHRIRKLVRLVARRDRLLGAGGECRRQTAKAVGGTYAN